MTAAPQEPLWLTVPQVVRIHAAQLALFGGPAGLRDENMLRSAIDRPKNKWAYGERSLAVVAAAYAFGLAKNHPFVDGNKRIAFAAMMVFAGKNGLALAPSQTEATRVILELAAGAIGEGEMAAWIAGASG